MKHLSKTMLMLAMATPLLLAAQTGKADMLADYSAQARTADPAFAGFDAERGRAFYLAAPATGKPETPSCTSCHTPEPKKPGQTRAGKVIDPMAKSVTPDRYTDPEKVEKWFRRNCNSVLGRECTLQEKGDFITFMLAQ